MRSHTHLSRSALLVCIVLAILTPALPVSGAIPATPEATPALPAATAPFGLGTVTLPYNEGSIADLLAQLPATVAGMPRNSAPGDRETDRFIATYGPVDPDFGPSLTLQAINLQTGDFFPTDFTVADFIGRATDPASDYDAVAFGQDGSLAWVRAEIAFAVEVNPHGTPASQRTIYTLAWGEVTSPWLFTAAAFSPKGLNDLVSAFVKTAGLPETFAGREPLPGARHAMRSPSPPVHVTQGSRGPW